MAESIYYQEPGDYNHILVTRQPRRGIEAPSPNLPLRHTYLYNLSFNYTKLITLIVAPFFC